MTGETPQRRSDPTDVLVGDFNAALMGEVNAGTDPRQLLVLISAIGTVTKRLLRDNGASKTACDITDASETLYADLVEQKFDLNLSPEAAHELYERGRQLGQNFMDNQRREV